VRCKSALRVSVAALPKAILSMYENAVPIAVTYQPARKRLLERRSLTHDGDQDHVALAQKSTFLLGCVLDRLTKFPQYDVSYQGHGMDVPSQVLSRIVAAFQRDFALDYPLPVGLFDLEYIQLEVVLGARCGCRCNGHGCDCAWLALAEGPKVSILYVELQMDKGVPRA
jgi:hypothetical protein